METNILKNTGYSNIDLSVEDCFKVGVLNLPSRTPDFTEGKDSQDSFIVPNTTCFTNHLTGTKLCKDLLTNYSLDQRKIFFISFNYHKDIQIKIRGKPKPLDRITQIDMYKHFVYTLMKMHIPSELKFCYTMYEQNKRGKVHFHQLIYIDNGTDYPNAHDYTCYLLEFLNPHKKDTSALKVQPFNGDGEKMFQYLFNKKEKAYEILNQERFKPHLYFHLK